MVKVGAHYQGNARCQFTVWAPLLQQIAVKIVSPQQQLLPMDSMVDGYWQVTAEDIKPGTRYLYQLEGEIERPDPASFFNPKAYILLLKWSINRLLFGQITLGMACP